MTNRIHRLREESLAAIPRISGERARLITEFHSNPESGLLSHPVRRAQAFSHFMLNKTLYFGSEELIVGERGEAPKATPTYPEVTIHTLDDLDILDRRSKIPFRVDPEVRTLYEREIIPFWLGRSMRERIFSHMDNAWKSAYEAGIFTEFMEQRAPGHTVLDGKIYRRGMIDFIADIHNEQAKIDWLNDPRAFARNEQLKAMKIAAQTLIDYAGRYAVKARDLAANETDANRHSGLLEIAAVCDRVPARAPESFHEALQYYWFVHVGVISELNTWDSFNPGRLDQHLLPFYRRGLESGILTEAQARELLQAFWIKFNNQPAPPKVGVTAEESGTYTDFALINLGGLCTDGADGVNEVTYLLLDVIEEMRLLQPSSMIQVSRKNPDAFIKRALQIIKTGYGQPSVFNTDAIIQELLRQGKSIEDARDGGASGCVETGAFGKESYILTGYFNLPKLMELALNNGIDMRTGLRLGPETGDVETFSEFDDFYQAFSRQVDHFIAVKIRGSNIIERLWAEFIPTPFLSLLIDDCIQQGRDYHDGGARYNTSYIQGVGLGTATDILSSIQTHVFNERRLDLGRLRDILAADFQGFEEIRQIFLNKTPHWGNDDDRADDLARRIFETYYQAVNGIPNTRGGSYRINLLPTTCHVYFGKVTGATADGRKAFQPLSEGISPVQGCDRHGPTAVIKSAAKIDHLRTGGTLLNQKFTPDFFRNESALTKLTHLIRSYFAMDGHHIQFNVVTADLLREAQAEPQKFRDLIVRVAGYSDYFVDLGADLQDEIIRRTEHPAV